MENKTIIIEYRECQTGVCLYDIDMCQEVPSTTDIVYM